MHPELPGETPALIVVDHGSRRQESNRMLEEIAQRFGTEAGIPIVEPAHMELAEPSIATALDRCVARGARFVVVHPFFLLPGKHWKEDIPTLVATAARRHPGLTYLVTAPLGLEPSITDIMRRRIEACLEHVRGATDGCEACRGTEQCRLEQEAEARE